MIENYFLPRSRRRLSIDYVLFFSLSLCTARMQHRFEIANIHPFVWFSSWAINDLIGIVCSHFIAIPFLLAERTILANLRYIESSGNKMYIGFWNHFIFESNVFLYCWERARVYMLYICVCGSFSSRIWIGRSRTFYFDCLCIHTYVLHQIDNWNWNAVVRCQKLMFFSWNLDERISGFATRQ